ncbi:MAG: RES family NAD+ phosphorylase [Solirubrobacteraceae bacterium]
MELVAYRCAAWETPFWSDPNPVQGRYNRAGEAPTTYLGLHPLTPWAESLRGGDRRADGDVLELRPPTWAVRVELDPADVVQLGFEDPAPLSAEQLVDDDLTSCQAFAAGLRADPTAPTAIIAPSAALPGTRNLILLGPRVLSPYLVDPVDPVIDVPGTLTAVRGRAALNLRDLVHYRAAGVPHPGLAAWQAGHDFDLSEPVLRPDELAAIAAAGP